MTEDKLKEKYEEFCWDLDMGKTVDKFPCPWCEKEVRCARADEDKLWEWINTHFERRDTLE